MKGAYRMTGALEAGFWGFVGGSALVLGALIAYFVRLPQRLIAAIMAFGSGVLISALSFELMQEAFESGGFTATALGFLGGAGVYTLANVWLSQRGAKHRKRSGHHEKQDSSSGGGMAIALGALLDGIPESIVIGVSLLAGQGVSLVAVIAVFLSNVPEGLSSAAGMHRAGRSAGYIFGVWGGIALASSVAAFLGYLLFAGVDPAWTAAVNAVAAGAILAMIADTMIPEAFEQTRDYAGFITVAGFLAAFALSQLGGGP
jgi:ZIP family zinc transporter